MESRGAKRSRRSKRSIVEEAEAAHAESVASGSAMSANEQEQRRVLIECATLLMQGRDRQAEFRQQTAAAREQAQGFRQSIEEHMRKEGVTCLRLSLAEAPYVRLFQSTSTARINVDSIVEAFENLTSEEVVSAVDELLRKEKRKRVADRKEIGMFDGLVHALFVKVRGMKSTGKISVKLGSTIEKGLKEEDVKSGSEEIEQLCSALLEVQQQLKTIGAKRKRDEEEANEKLKMLEEEAQHILLDRHHPEEDVETMNRGNFKLRCKRVQKMPVTKLRELKEDILPRAFDEFRAQLSDSQGVAVFLSDDSMTGRIRASLETIFSEREPTVSTKISLDKVGSRVVSVSK